ncbi:MAG: hypothetical protein QM786_19360 [Breznakibacter sp.]
MIRTLAYLYLSVALCAAMPMAHAQGKPGFWIEQDGQRIVVQHDVVTLQKDDFDLMFKISKGEAVLVNASLQPHSYHMAQRGEETTRIPGFESTGMAEGLFNPDLELFISNDSPSYWFYDNAKSHRFNSAEPAKGKFICRRTVQTLYDVDGEKRINIRQLSAPLYLVIVFEKKTKKNPPATETEKVWLKINWK